MQLDFILQPEESSLLAFRKNASLSYRLEPEFAACVKPMKIIDLWMFVTDYRKGVAQII